jgi:hypothetical protein
MGTLVIQDETMAAYFPDAGAEMRSAAPRR